MNKNDSQTPRSKWPARSAIVAVLVIAVALMLAWSSSVSANVPKLRYIGVNEPGYPVSQEVRFIGANDPGYPASQEVRYIGTNEPGYPASFWLPLPASGAPGE